MYVLFFLISFGASIIGAICGIGGGVIIKPVLDASGTLLPGTINFLSGCTVLAMTCYSVLRNRLSGATSIDGKTALPLAVGAAVGGLTGKQLFDVVEGLFPDPALAGAVQAIALGIITLGTLAYNLNKDRIKTLQIAGAAACVVIGFALGVMSSFLGIGGGPINLVVLYFFFSMGTKQAAQNSLFIILCSQATSTLTSLPTVDFSVIDITLIIGMIFCGIMGGVCGRIINKRIDEKHVDKLFSGLMVVIILVCIYNAAKHLIG